VFEAADDLVIAIYQLTAELPPAERFGLQAQIRRAAVSTATNIVVGSSRATTSEYRRFLNVSHGSARESEYLLRLTVRLKMLRADQVNPIAERYDRLQASLGAMARSLAAGETDRPRR